MLLEDATHGQSSEQTQQYRDTRLKIYFTISFIDKKRSFGCGEMASPDATWFVSRKIMSLKSI